MKSSSRKKQHVSGTKETFERVIKEGRNNTNTETNSTKRKRQWSTDNAEVKTQKKRIKLIRTHKKCSSKEFDNRLKLLKKRKQKLQK